MPASTAPTRSRRRCSTSGCACSRRCRDRSCGCSATTVGRSGTCATRRRRADLALDTLPCNAHTTASDALWAGVPLLTCAGRGLPARVAGSLLKAIGLPELVTASLEEYEAMALDLARSPGRLAELRARLQANRTTWPLFDAARFCRHLEAAYLEMWRLNQAGEEPRSFSVRALPR